MDAVIFIDTSAFVAILADEADAAAFAEAIEAASAKATAPHVRLEACMVASTRLRRSPREIERAFDALLEAAQIVVLPLSDEIGRLAVDAFERFGEGRGHKAQLNLADCLSYAAAKHAGAAILFKGRDFSRTDLARVLKE